MRKIIVRTAAPWGQKPDVRFFNAAAGEPGGPPATEGLLSASRVDDRVLRSHYGAGSEGGIVVPRAAWTIRLRGRR
jgi:hypothetical protein